MMFMHRLGTIFLVGVGLGGFSACTSVLVNKPVSKKADGWVLTLSEVKEGPDEYIGEGAVNLRSGDGEKLVWTLLTVKSELADEQPFSYDTCSLGGTGKDAEPIAVARYPEIDVAADRAEDFAPGQERTRQLIFRYPKDKRPPRVKCGTIVLPIPAR